ncbi:helix-turn-helix transcriptional regulator [Nostoc sp. CHAB 5836]|uniref:helix-turn-helix domain-containing protein n=1 Tax=Nostoc sp. CHAB 5836 TaxID=2780404 RepID=UPI001E52BF3F|nr:helix-turn-helix transcriptional regulator [Nostoc sp. CHAB 5836]MCC5618801.1 helix-turn-helix transcriptional regulator [Nostoc sp. CHAB 5836]
MNQTLIKWRLKEIMARYDIRAGDLAKTMGVSHNSIANLRKAKTMPRLDGESLNRLCNALNYLAEDLQGEITPTDLISYTKDSGTPTSVEIPGDSGRSLLNQNKNPRSTDAQTQSSLSSA